MPNGRKRRLPHRNGTLSQIGRILWKHIAHLLKTNLTKFAVICLKKRQKARFLSPRSSKIIVTKEKERIKRKREEKKENNGCTLSFYNSYRYPPNPSPLPIISHNSLRVIKHRLLHLKSARSAEVAFRGRLIFYISFWPPASKFSGRHH